MRGVGTRVLAAPFAQDGSARLSALALGFALLGDSLFPNAGRPAPKKVSKNACPCIRVSLRSTSLTPSALRGPAYKGHPWPFIAGTPSSLAASMPLAPLRPDSVRPPERGIRWGLMASSSTNKQRVLVPLFANFQAAQTRLPFRRPSVGAAQGDARHGRRARSEGTGTSLRDGPRSSAGGREVLRSKTRMQGWPSFWLLFLGQTRKSDAPCKAQPVVPAEESVAPDTDVRAGKGKASRPKPTASPLSKPHHPANAFIPIT